MTTRYDYCDEEYEAWKLADKFARECKHTWRTTGIMDDFVLVCTNCGYTDEQVDALMEGTE